MRAIIDDCRRTLDTVRQDLSLDRFASRSSTAGNLEQRLGRIADRLDGAAGMLDQCLDLADRQAPPAPVDMLNRDFYHRVWNSPQTMTVLHGAAPANGPVLTLDIAAYLEGLCSALGKLMATDGERRTLQICLSPLVVPRDTARHVGVLVSELVTNAFRHAFPSDRRGTVKVTGARRNRFYQLCVEDDGKGLPAGFDLRLPSGCGLRLVNMLADRARARLTVSGRGGACFTLNLPVPPADDRH